MIEARALSSYELRRREIHVLGPQQIKKPKKKKGRYLVALFLATSLAMTSLYQFALLTEGQFRMEHLSMELKEVRAQNERLGVEVAKLKSVARIEDIAKEKLNMTKPESHRIFYINEY